MPSFIIATAPIPVVPVVVSRCCSGNIGSERNTNVLNVIPLLKHGGATEWYY